MIKLIHWPLKALIKVILGGRIGWPSRATPSTFGLAYEEVVFSSRDGVQLSGWLLPHPQARGLILTCHGIFSTRRSMLHKAAWLHRRGFASLLFDFRGRGRSAGSHCSLGVHEPLDVLAALDYIQERPDLNRLPLGALAESLGAAALVSALQQDKHLQAACLEACFATMKEAVWKRCQVLTGPFAPLVYPWVLEHLRNEWQLDVDLVNPLQTIGQIGRPVLLIHDQLDWSLPLATSQRLYLQAAHPKQLWVAPRSLHCRASRMASQAYQSTVGEFLERHLVTD